MGSTIRVVHSAKLAADPEIASAVLRLMMAMNDIGVANDALQEWDTTENPKRKLRRDGGKLYFGRIMRVALDDILGRLHAMAMAFLDFAGHFIRHYAK